MKPILLTLSLCVAWLTAPGQSSLWIRTALNASQYEWSSDELKKRNAEGQIEYSWQQPAGGDITWIDPANPFRILVFIRQSDQVLWLNNKLSPVAGPVFLPDYGINLPVAAASAKDGGLWVIDASSANLVKFNPRMDKEFQKPFQVPQNNTNIQMAEWKDYLSVLLPGKTLWIADLYGQFLKKIPTAAARLDIGADGFVLTGDKDRQVYQPDNGIIKPLIKKP